MGNERRDGCFGECLFGLARGDITPPAGIYHRMWGAARHDRAEGVHRPLTATAVVFRSFGDGGRQQQQILLALDHCLLGTREVDPLLDAVARGGGVERDMVAVTYSHTHAAGLMTLDRTDLPGGELIPGYLGQVAKTCGQLVAEALERIEPVEITYARGRSALAAQRDYWDAERGQYVCGYNPHAEADDTVLLARVTAGPRLLATIVNYACHPTTLAWDNRLVSPDYPGAMRELVERETGAPCVFLQGASGELGPKQGYVGDVEVADRNGRQLGYAALASLEGFPPPCTEFRYAGPVVSGATLGTWVYEPLSEERHEQVRAWSLRRWHLPLDYRADLPDVDTVSSELARWDDQERTARASGDDSSASAARTMAERQRRLLARIRSLPDGPAYPLPIVIWRIGEGVWVAVEGEHYSLLQRALRDRFPQHAIMVITLMNSWRPAYIPSADVYGKGIYQESIAVLAPGSLEKLVDEIAAAIESL